jgi:tRNA U34 5-carboxymethylaminomethyl modifying GTPase MnmE/TrmE
LKAESAASFLIVVDNNSKTLPNIPREITNLLTDQNTLLIINKTNLPTIADLNEFLPHMDRVEISIKMKPTQKF